MKAPSIPVCKALIMALSAPLLLTPLLVGSDAFSEEAPGNFLGLIRKRNSPADEKLTPKPKRKPKSVAAAPVAEKAAEKATPAAAAPAESDRSLKLEFSGMAWLEYERTAHFGYDGTGAQPNFDSGATQGKTNNMNFFANLGLTASRAETKAVSLFEMGEIFFGDSASGAAQGARQKIIEVRNLYLEHGFSPTVTGRGGIISTASDPRAFIFSDHLASVQASLKSESAEMLLWYGNANQNRVGATPTRDAYVGFSITTELSILGKGAIFGTYRSLAGDSFAVDQSGTYVATTGDSNYYWIGGTFDLTHEGPWSTQATLIGNFGKTSLGTTESSHSAYLADARITYNWLDKKTSFTLEGLMTPGAAATDAGTGKVIAGRRKNFMSPVGTSYLMTIATSDGADDAPGSLKESTIATLGQEEGLRIAVFTATHVFSEQLTGFARVGMIRTAVNGANGSTRIGEEIDIGWAYKLTPETTLQVDWGHFMPGPFFALRAPADLFAARMKFAF